MPNKLTYEFVYQAFIDGGCKLLETTYEGKDKLMRYLCDCEEESKISYANFRKGRRCYKCGREKQAAKRRLDYEEVKKYFKDNGCVLLSKEYKNSMTPMAYMCECDRESKISYSNFKKGRRCQKCKGEFNSKNQTLDISYIEYVLGQDGYKLIAGEYKNYDSKLTIECPLGHIIDMRYGIFHTGCRCRICGYEKRKQEGHPGWKPDREKLKIDRTFARKCQNALKNTLNAIRKNKNTRSHILNGYLWTDLKEYITSHPNWNNVKDTDWELDHIFPITAFTEYGLTEIKHIKIINGLDNLQPLIRKDNREKYNKYNKDDFEAWLKEKGVWDSL